MTAASSSRRRAVIPGFGLTMGFTVAYLSLIVLIPLAGLFFKTSGLGWDGFWRVVSAPRTLAALRLSFGAALVGALVNAVFGTLVAWVLVRYRFPGKRFFDATIDLPFALPTAVAGIALTALYAGNGWIGQFLEPHGIKVAYTPLGVIIACTFIGLPFVVRSVQPLLEEAERELEEAAASLGASRLQSARSRRCSSPSSSRNSTTPAPLRWRWRCWCCRWCCWWPSMHCRPGAGAIG
jgi:sulfate transport system permease protein